MAVWSRLKRGVLAPFLFNSPSLSPSLFWYVLHPNRIPERENDMANPVCRFGVSGIWVGKRADAAA